MKGLQREGVLNMRLQGNLLNWGNVGHPAFTADTAQDRFVSVFEPYYADAWVSTYGLTSIVSRLTYAGG